MDFDLANFMTGEIATRHQRATEIAAAELAAMDRQMVFLIARGLFARSCEYPGDGDLVRAIPFSEIEGDVVDGLFSAIMARPIISAGPECVNHITVWKAMQ